MKVVNKLRKWKYNKYTVESEVGRKENKREK